MDRNLVGEYAAPICDGLLPFVRTINSYPERNGNMPEASPEGGKVRFKRYSPPPAEHYETWVELPYVSAIGPMLVRGSANDRHNRTPPPVVSRARWPSCCRARIRL